MAIPHFTWPHALYAPTSGPAPGEKPRFAATMDFAAALQLIDEVVMLGASWRVLALRQHGQERPDAFLRDARYEVCVAYVDGHDGTSEYIVSPAHFDHWRQHTVPADIAFLRTLP